MNEAIETYVIFTPKGYFAEPYNINGIGFRAKWDATFDKATHYDSELEAKRAMHRFGLYGEIQYRIIH